MRRLIRFLFYLALIGVPVAWYLTEPTYLPEDAMAAYSADAERGRMVFLAGGCSSCHAAKGASDDALLVLSGGREFASPFGTFVAPNISSDVEQGIGAWSTLELANAMVNGVSPLGEHYFPAFPYTSYTRVKLADIADLRSYLATLPASAVPNKPHLVAFPFNIRRSLGGWKLLFLRRGPVAAAHSDQITRGRELVEGLGHCSECHTPRNFLGGSEFQKWLTGGPNPSGRGKIPDITATGLGWSSDEITEYLTSGFTPEFDSAGGEMAAIIHNISQLPEEDRRAIAAYLLTINSN